MDPADFFSIGSFAHPRKEWKEQLSGLSEPTEHTHNVCLRFALYVHFRLMRASRVLTVIEFSFERERENGWKVFALVTLKEINSQGDVANDEFIANSSFYT